MATANPTQIQEEVWKSPPSLNKWWVEVSNFGRVRTLDRYEGYERLGKHLKRWKQGRLLNISEDSRGRPILCNQKTDNKKCRLVRTLVAECFVRNENPAKLRFVYHKDGNPANCRADNLVWGNHKYDHYLCGRPIGLFFDYEKEPHMVGSISRIAERLGVTKQSVHIAIQKNRRCCGATVKYLPIGTPMKDWEDSFPDELYTDT